MDNMGFGYAARVQLESMKTSSDPLIQRSSREGFILRYILDVKESFLKFAKIPSDRFISFEHVIPDKKLGSKIAKSCSETGQRNACGRTISVYLEEHTRPATPKKVDGSDFFVIWNYV